MSRYLGRSLRSDLWSGIVIMSFILIGAKDVLGAEGDLPEQEQVSESSEEKASAGSGDDLPDATVVTTPSNPAKSVTVPIRPRRRVRRRRERQADGTKARRRAETKFIIQSRYRIDGRNLEVDPE